MSSTSPVKVPIGPQSVHWNTAPIQRTVLVLAHNITALTRLLDVIPVFDSDPRVQVVFSWNGADPFRHGLDALLDELGVITIPWDQAIQSEFDLAITANHSGLTEINAPVVVVSHGIGYTKYSPGETRKPGNPETREVFGLAPRWVTYDGRPIAAALVFSHEEQRDRLAVSAPAALSSAVVAGDPCYDRILASRALREHYRQALGVADGRRLVVLSSTWGPRSLVGAWPDLCRALLADLPADSYQVAAALHPNLWHGHSPWQVRTWLAGCVRAGLALIPPVEGWRAALIAADCVIGDHGSVTSYGAALDIPTLLGAFPADDVAPGSPVDVLGGLAPRLDRAGGLRGQVDLAIDRHRPGQYAAVTELVSSVPGESAARLRALCYSLLRLAEPAGEVPVPRLPITGLPGRRLTPSASLVSCEFTATTATLTRYPAEPWQGRPDGPPLPSTHLAVSADHPGQRFLGAADVLLAAEPDLSLGAERWLADTGRTRTAAVVTGANTCLASTRDGKWIEVVADDRSTCDPALFASVAHAWLATGNPIDGLGPELTVQAGQTSGRVRISQRLRRTAAR